MTKYLLDANVLMEAQKRHWWSMDICPAFWEWVLLGHSNGMLFSHKVVKDEICKGNDCLVAWAKERDDQFFISDDEKTTVSMSVVSNWASKQSYTAAAVSGLFSDADYTLVSCAHALGMTMVTHEKSENKISEVKIPDACKGLGVRCLTPSEMLRAEKVSFGPARSA